MNVKENLGRVIDNLAGAAYSESNHHPAQQMEKAFKLAENALDEIDKDGGNTANAVAQLSEAIKLVESCNDRSMWDSRMLYRIIYEGGDGSSYESTTFRNVPVGNVPEALKLAKEKAYEQDRIIDSPE